MSGVHRSLDDITPTELVRESAGRHAWKVPADDARAAVDRWVHEIAVHADDTPTGRYIACRAEQLLDATA